MMSVKISELVFGQVRSLLFSARNIRSESSPLFCLSGICLERARSLSFPRLALIPDGLVDEIGPHLCRKNALASAQPAQSSL